MSDKADALLALLALPDPEDLEISEPKRTQDGKPDRYQQIPYLALTFIAHRQQAREDRAE